MPKAVLQLHSYLRQLNLTVLPSEPQESHVAIKDRSMASPALGGLQVRHGCRELMWVA